MKICFIHPDLGIGGAERLIVDAASGLVKLGHEVTIYTSHHDQNHCFEETKDGSIKVCVLGDTLFPTSLVGNRFRAVCAYLRNLHLATLLKAKKVGFDIIIVDQISVSIPILRLLGAKILFYCHFPDKLLTKRESFLKYLYRLPVDKIEEWTTGLAELIVVNSQFTLSVFKEAFPSLSNTPVVLYPGIQTDNYENKTKLAKNNTLSACLGNSEVLLSINRFERKKNISLAIYSFAELVQDSRFASRNLKLVIAGTLLVVFIIQVLEGGYDSDSLENQLHLSELNNLAIDLGFESFIMWESVPISLVAQIIFLPSFSQDQRTLLLERANCLLYTPSFEHFGIVPVEAMYSQVPVIAVNNGGPCETIVDGETGFLVSSNPKSMAQAISKILLDPTLEKKLGQQGRLRVLENFTSEIFDGSLSTLLANLQSKPSLNHFLSLCIAKILYSLFLTLSLFENYLTLFFIIPILVAAALAFLLR